MPCGEIETAYKERPEGSVSKLSTYRDGWRILKLIGAPGQGRAAAAVLRPARPCDRPQRDRARRAGRRDYLETGLVPRLPTAVLSIGLVILGVLSFFVGLILDMVTRTRQEMKRLVYLSLPRSRAG